MPFRSLLIATVLALAITTPAAAETSQGSLFVNLTTDESHRVDMATAFSKAMGERGHPLIIWLNDKGVLLAAKSNAGKFATQQKAIAALVAGGAKLIVCPMCMKAYGVTETDLIEGATVGNPDLTSELLFKEGTRTLTW